MILEGQAPRGELYFLKINRDGEATLVPADDYKGARTYALVEAIHKTEAEDWAVLCIGPAGEYRLAGASIQSSDADGRPCRAAGRGGLGAVMGSKGLKALIVDRNGRNPDAIIDKDAFRKAAKVFAKAVKEDMFCGYVLPPPGNGGTGGAHQCRRSVSKL